MNLSALSARPSASAPVRTRRPKVAIATHGCKLNQAESDALKRRFAQAQCQIVGVNDAADIYILNTCSVTHAADAKARQWLRSVHRNNPQALLVATGCYASHASTALYQVKGVGLVVDNRDKHRLADILEERGWLEKYGSLPVGEPWDANHELNFPFRTRSFVKIQEGCNQFCAFCIVPYTRGRESSRPIPEVVEEVDQRVAEGYKEVVLTGPQIGSYGMYPPAPESRRDPEDYDGRLHGLVETVLSKTTIQRLRLSSIQPQDLTQRLLETWKDPRLCRHVHMSLQSGSETVLRRMRRRYTAREYRQAVARLRDVVPDIAITTDVIVGFPGESDRDFQESYEFCRDMEFAAIHVFPFSRRSGTRAAEMSDRVSDSLKRDRMERMLSLSSETAKRFRRKFLGRRLSVLWEEKRQIDGRVYWTGFTDNYLKTYAVSAQLQPNCIQEVEFNQEFSNGLLGKVVGDRDFH